MSQEIDPDTHVRVSFSCIFWVFYVVLRTGSSKVRESGITACTKASKQDHILQGQFRTLPLNTIYSLQFSFGVCPKTTVCMILFILMYSLDLSQIEDQSNKDTNQVSYIFSSDIWLQQNCRMIVLWKSSCNVHTSFIWLLHSFYTAFLRLSYGYYEAAKKLQISCKKAANKPQESRKKATWSIRD